MCQAQDDIIEVQLNSVWVTGILGDPMYNACKNCGTKVDPVTGHCKRHESQNCQTIREEQASILATVTLADHTGEVDRILVDGDRLATNGRKPGGGRSNVPAAAQGVLQSQESESDMENLPECQFQVLACQPALCQEYSDSHRPMIKKIVRLENQRATGMAFPIACPRRPFVL